MHDNNLNQIIELRHYLHQHPELSGQETKTIEILQSFLRARTSLEIVSKDGWFYAVKKCNKDRCPKNVIDRIPEGAADKWLGDEADKSLGDEADKRPSVMTDKQPIAFRADMDALPMDEGAFLPYASVNKGVAHKCGHDGHMAALCGLALELDQIDVSRTVYLIFQPAEEIGAGAVKCKDLIKEKSISEIYAFHNLSGYPENSIVIRRGLTQPASEGLTIRFTGRQSHASAPEDGISSGPAIAKLVLYAEKLAEMDWPGMALCTLVGMRCGNDDFGISAGSGHVSFTLRAEQEEVMKEMEKRLLRQAEELARAAHLCVASDISDYFPETRNSDTAVDRIIRHAHTLKLETIEMNQIWRASEDFGHYLKECPGAMLYIGNGEKYPPVHTSEYDFNDNILETAVDMFMKIATDG